MYAEKKIYILPISWETWSCQKSSLLTFPKWYEMKHSAKKEGISLKGKKALPFLSLLPLSLPLVFIISIDERDPPHIRPFTDIFQNSDLQCLFSGFPLRSWGMVSIVPTLSYHFYLPRREKTKRNLLKAAQHSADFTSFIHLSSLSLSLSPSLYPPLSLPHFFFINPLCCISLCYIFLYLWSVWICVKWSTKEKCDGSN